jgi:hypothetical protein
MGRQFRHVAMRNRTITFAYNLPLQGFSLEGIRAREQAVYHDYSDYHRHPVHADADKEIRNRTKHNKNDKEIS